MSIATHTKAEILDWYLKILDDKLCCDLRFENYEETSRLEFDHDLGADSLDMVEIVMEIEVRMSIQILDEEAQKAVTVGDLFDLVCEKLKI